MAIKSFGTQITVDGETVGSLTSIALDGREATIIDVTTHSSLENTREFIGGLITPAVLSLEGFFDLEDDGQNVIRENSGAEKDCTIVFSDGYGFSFSAIIKTNGESAPLDEALPFVASLQINSVYEAIEPSED